ncbi:PilZ domain-containing protein [bacterium]|nr:PilZ domain-containing protein [bacterium]
MIQQDTADLGRYPQEGSAISIQGESKQTLAATVVTSSPAEIWLELARPTSQDLFQEGERVRIKYWDEGAVVYYWEAEVINITPSGKRHVAISIHDKGVTVQRRKSPRVSVLIPFWFTVIDAADSKLIGERVADCQTENISVSGLLFKTPLSLQAGDKLELHLHCLPSHPLNAVGWVVRSNPFELDGNPLNLVALEFLQMEEGEQCHLLEFLVQHQSKQATVNNGPG